MFVSPLVLRRCNCLLLHHLRRMGTPMRHISPQRRPQSIPVIRKELGIVRSARHGDVGHAVIEKVLGPKLRIEMDKHTMGGLALAGMAGHGIAVIQVRMLRRVDLNGTPVIHLQSHPTLSDTLHRAQFTVRQFQLG